MKTRILFAILVLVLLPAASPADICNDVNDIANGWNEMANAVHELDLSQITEADAAEIDAMIEASFDATSDFAALLEENGNETEVGLGRDLGWSLDALADAEGIDAVVDAMDAVVDSLDAVVDYCDEQ